MVLVIFKEDGGITRVPVCERAIAVRRCIAPRDLLPILLGDRMCSRGQLEYRVSLFGEYPAEGTR